jgi:serine protease AprX
MHANTLSPAVWRWRTTWIVLAATLLATLALVAAASHATPSASAASGGPAAATPAGTAAPDLSRLAARTPRRSVEVIVQLRPGTSPATGKAIVAAAGGRVTRELHLIRGLGARMNAAAARDLAGHSGVLGVSLNAKVRSESLDPKQLATSFNASTRTPSLWEKDATGRGVGVAVLDTGIAGDLPDFGTSAQDPTSRVIASVVTNPDATTAGDGYGHGTHVAGLIAGNSDHRPASDPLRGRYAGTAPDANLINVKVSDDHGASTVLDVIYGLQFAVDHKDELGIRVVNLSLRSASAQSYRDDPLDAAVEQAWFKGLVVVAAAGNSGTADDAVSHAPGNDPYAITVGAVDDQGTKDIKDDVLAPWSSRGVTQDGVAKPEITAPGTRLVSTLAPGSDYASLCPACVTDGEYFRVGGSSMAAAVVSGIAADLIAKHSSWTPDQVKGAIVTTGRLLTGVTAKEANAEKARDAAGPQLVSNVGLLPNTFIDAATGTIDTSRATWSCDCLGTATEGVDSTRATWSRATWSTFFEH